MGLSELITQLPELIGQAVEANQWLGYGAIFAAMFLENLFPPIPSELIMPLGGFYVQQGQLQFIPVVLAGLIGTVLGALPWYGIGRLINEQRIEQWLDSMAAGSVLVRGVGAESPLVQPLRHRLGVLGTVGAWHSHPDFGSCRDRADADGAIFDLDHGWQLDLDAVAHHRWHGAR